MADPTRTPQTSTAQRPGWCDWHKGTSETAILIDAIERNSGAPYPLYACAPCREQRGLTPFADQP